MIKTMTAAPGFDWRRVRPGTMVVFASPDQEFVAPAVDPERVTVRGGGGAMERTAEQKRLLEEVRAALAAMTDEDQVLLLDDLASGYCRLCGREEPDDRGCQCWNDE